MGLKLLYEKTKDAVRILRCFSKAQEIILPEQIDGSPVTELGDYIFSADMRNEPKGYLWKDDASWEEESMPDGSQRQENRIYNASEIGEAVCGEKIKKLSLPRSLKKIGKYAFYNCDGLRHLAFFSTVRDIGAGAFNGCRKIEELTVTAAEGEKSCLREILSELNETVEVHYLTEGEEKNRAELLFPAFYEEAVENTPARITETHVHGCGHRYRYCFKDTRFQFSEYDSVFPYMKAQENAEETVKLATDRLRFPMELSQAAGYEYRTYLLEHLENTAEYICSLEDVSLWEWLVNECFGIKKVEHAAAGFLGNEGLAGCAHEEYSNIKEPVLDKTGFDKLVETAVRHGQTEAVSFLMDAGRKAFPRKQNKFEL